MDEIAESIGKLSTDAKEWIPGRNLGTEKQLKTLSTNSKEFIPKRSVSLPSSSLVSLPKSYQRSSTTSHENSFAEYSSDTSSLNVPKSLPQSISLSEPAPSIAILPPQKRSTYVSTNNVHVASAPSLPRSIPSLGSSQFNHSLWKLYRQRNILATQAMPPDDNRYLALPPNFAHGYCLDSSSSTTRSSTRSSFGYPTATYKVVSLDDGRIYCLRRIDNVKCVNNSIALAISQAWNSATFQKESDIDDHHYETMQGQRHSRIQPNDGKHHAVVQHPGIVRLYKCWFHSQNRAVFFLHEYYAGAVTLAEWVQLRQDSHSIMPEYILWNILTQLVSAVRAVHKGNLACRTLELNHILVTPDLSNGIRADAPLDPKSQFILPLATKRIRVRINCIGVVDALEYEARKSLIDLQRKDLRDLGHVILSLATGCPKFIEPSILIQYEGFMRQHYSSKLCDYTMALMKLDFAPVPTIDPVCRWLTNHSFDEMDAYHAIADTMDETLATEFESSRVLRLMLKLAFINERPEFGVDPRWSESGDNYILKLFRDYGRYQIFHHFHRVIGNLCLRP